MKSLIAALTITLLSFTLGCSKKVSVHPGATSNLDSYAYDELLIQQAVLTQASADFHAGKLPPQAKAPLNAAIKQYMVTRAAWQAYHANGSDAPVLQQAITTLIAAVAELQKVLGGTVQPVAPTSSLEPLSPLEVQTMLMVGAL